MKKFLWYSLLILTTIAAIICASNNFMEPLCYVIIIWGIIIGIKIYKEKKKQFRDWEFKKYNHNAESKKDQKEHYKEYKNERKNNKSAK